jgi:hypothetical protein
MEMFLSLDEFPTFSRLKSDRASYHPDEGVSHFSPLILQMSLSSEAHLDHIADFLKLKERHKVTINGSLILVFS